jgi:hypothetical protein
MTDFRIYTGKLPRMTYQSDNIKTTSYVTQIKQSTGHELDIIANNESANSESSSANKNGKEFIVNLFTSPVDFNFIDNSVPAQVQLANPPYTSWFSFAIQGASWDQISQFNPVVTVYEQTLDQPVPEGAVCFYWTDQGDPGIPRAETLDDFINAVGYCYYIMNSSSPGNSSICINWSNDSWNNVPTNNIPLPDLGVNPYDQQSPNSPISNPFFCIIIGNDVVGLMQNPNGNGGAIWNTYNYIPEGGGC